MSYKIAGAPCSWGVDDPKNPFLPPWERVLKEAHQAGYKSIELGPYGFLPTNSSQLNDALVKNELSIVAGTIFDDLLSENNFNNIKALAKNICSVISNVPKAESDSSIKYKTPYLVIIDWGDPIRAKMAGQVKASPRLSSSDWQKMMGHIKDVSKIAFEEYGIRSVIHPHAGGYIEFFDEIEHLVDDISYEQVGLCLDTGHLYYSGMDPIEWLKKYYDRLDYIHFKDVNAELYQRILPQQLNFFDACAKGVMCPIGTGIIDYPAVKKLLDELDYNGWITIEQERDPRDVEGSLSDVTNSLKFLRSVGF